MPKSGRLHGAVKVDPIIDVGLSNTIRHEHDNGRNGGWEITTLSPPPSGFFFFFLHSLPTAVLVHNVTVVMDTCLQLIPPHKLPPTPTPSTILRSFYYPSSERETEEAGAWEV